jgi:hypothetical protein
MEHQPESIAQWWNLGRNYRPGASALAANTVFNTPRVFNMQLPAYKRVDFGLARTIAYEKIRWRYSLDIQNVFG